MGRREWTEMDEQMEREGNATRRAMRSVGQRPGARNNDSHDRDRATAEQKATRRWLATS